MRSVRTIFLKFRCTMVRDGYELGFVIVVLWALYSYLFVNRHVCSILLIALYCILLFERLKVFCLLM